MQVFDRRSDDRLADSPQVLPEDLDGVIAHAAWTAFRDQARDVLRYHWPGLSLNFRQVRTHVGGR